MRVGITATRYPPTVRQRKLLHRTLRDGLHEDDDLITELHHGACTGGDALAHEIALLMDLFIYVHPPINPRWLYYEAVLNPGPKVIVLPAKGYHERNDDIVAASAAMIVMPNSYEPQPHSGTWSTYAKAVEAHKPTLMIFPDGTSRYDGNE
jgi:hypothetical protein